MFEGFQQAADVRLRDGIAAGGQASGQFLLAERGTLLFVEGLEAVHGEGAFDEAELGMQVVLGEMAEQRAGFIGPWLEQAVEVKEALVGGFLPELVEDGQAGVAAIANDVVAFPGAPGNGRWLIQPAFPDRGFQLVVERIAQGARVVFVGTQLLQADADRRVA